MSTSRALHMCLSANCREVFDTSEQLMYHEQNHWNSKFANKKVRRQLQLLNNSQNNSFNTNIIRNQSIVKAVRVDDVAYLATRSQTFHRNITSSLESLPTHIEPVPITPEETVMFASKSRDIFVCSVCNKIWDSRKQLMQHARSHLTCKFCKTKVRGITQLDTHYNKCFMNLGKNLNYLPYDSTECNHLETVCVSNDSDDEIVCLDLPNHITSTTVSHTAGSFNEVNTVPQDSIPDRQSNIAHNTNLSEKELVTLLRKKYSSSVLKCDNSCQTITSAKYNVSLTCSNAIVLENLVTELSAYKIPVEFEAQSTLSAKFHEELAIVSIPSLECWANKKVIDIEKGNCKTQKFHCS